MAEKSHILPSRSLLLVINSRSVGTEMTGVRRDECRLGDEKCARRGRALCVIRRRNVGVNVLIICAAARERGEHDAMRQQHLADLRGLKKPRRGIGLCSHGVGVLDSRSGRGEVSYRPFWHLVYILSAGIYGPLSRAAPTAEESNAGSDRDPVTRESNSRRSCITESG